MTRQENWERIRPLGQGGQSEVFLVRRPTRVAARRVCLDKLTRLSAMGAWNEAEAREFAVACAEFARPEQIDELGALKIFKPRAAGPDSEQHAKRRLQSEIAVLNQRRPGLVGLLEANESEGWIVTEYCSEGTLEQHPTRYAGNALGALLALRPLVETVAGLHKDGIFHRDIKPANVFIDRGGRLILGDFGIVFLPGLPERITLTNESVGPHDYMPPWGDSEERIQKVGGNFDVYMLGKLLWCMVSGRLKLPREWHKRADYDLTVKYEGNPHMYAINTILDKCVVENACDCLPAAQELLLVVDAHLSVMLRAGQLLSDGVPRPCRVCGKGFYRLSEERSGRPNQVLGVPVGTTAVPGQYVNSWRQDGACYLSFLVCDVCKHTEFFMLS